VQTLAPLYREGKVRLPGKDSGFVCSQRLIEEVTRYTGIASTGTRTDDCLMAHWFFEWNLPHLRGRGHKAQRAWRPTWFSGQQRDNVTPWGTRRILPAHA
jgi:hypothetical protein